MLQYIFNKVKVLRHVSEFCFFLPVMPDLNYFHLRYQDATKINLPEALMNWLPMRETDSTRSSSLTESRQNNQSRAQQNASSHNIQTIKDTNRKLTSGPMMPERDRQGAGQ